jgi:thiamine-monophosphate kinase
VDAFRSPRARVEEGQALAGGRHAAIDVSDGLAAECRTLAAASDVQLVLDEAWLRAALSPELILAASALERDALAFALDGGEDYALLVAGPARVRPRGAVDIGEVRPGRGARLRRAGALEPLTGGYDHLR